STRWTTQCPALETWPQRDTAWHLILCVQRRLMEDVLPADCHKITTKIPHLCHQIIMLSRRWRRTFPPPCHPEQRRGGWKAQTPVRCPLLRGGGHCHANASCIGSYVSAWLAAFSATVLTVY